MGSQSATVAKQSSSQLVGHSARNAPASGPLTPFAEEQAFVPPGAGALPRSVVKIAAGGPSEPNPSRSLRLMPLSFPLQRKLAIGETHDPLESEADRMADRVLRMTNPAAPVASSSAPPTLQRKCACQGTGSQCKECDEAQHGKKLHRKAASAQTAASSHEAPPIVHDVLRSPGRPLDSATRAFFEPRFGYDFSKVRVHADTRASKSAQAVNALAYTVGRDLVFSAGRYSPDTTEGRRLLAHELTHVTQQNGAEVPSASSGLAGFPDKARGAQHSRSIVNVGSPDSGQTSVKPDRPVAPAPVRGVGVQLARSWNDCGAERDCPQRQSGERARAAAATLQVGTLDAPESGEIVSHFNIGSSSLRGLSGNPTWKSFVSMITAEDSRWEILGFSDCEGGTERNEQLRLHRAQAVLHALPPAAQAKIDRAIAAPLTDCVGENFVEWDRSLNRSVLFRRTAETITFPADPVAVTLPSCICGPDVTAQVAAAAASIVTTFAGLSSDHKDAACNALDSYEPVSLNPPLTIGAIAWDIPELHNHAWIPKNYRPTCATKTTDKHCGLNDKGEAANFSVQIAQQCYYSGSVNYVIFGTMCKLCADYYLSVPLINTGYARFTRAAMKNLIDTYKGTGFSGLATPSSNFGSSVAWADSGYDGWPTGGSLPPGDCSCGPLCPTPYSGPSFHVNWFPIEFHTGGPRMKERQKRSNK